MTLLEQRPAQAIREDSGPALRTERLVLRAPRLTDIKAIATLANDLRVAAMTARIPHPYSAADAEEFVSQIATSGNIAFAITLAGGPLIGLCGIDRAGGEKPEIGYWLGAPHWNKGYATEAARALIDHAFEDLAIDTLEAGARIVNPASRNVLEKCGFEWTRVVLRRVRALSTSVPCDRFGLERTRWAALKDTGKVGRAARRAGLTRSKFSARKA